MTFPSTPLDVRTELQIDGAWIDCSGDVYTREPITIERGSADEASSGEPSRCSLTINNRDGRYSPRNPMSPYFGLIGRNTPIRVSVQGPESYLRLEGNTSSYARTPDAATLDITGDIDLRVEATCDWYGPASQALIGKYTSAGDQRSYLMQLVGGGIYFWWSINGSTNYFAWQELPSMPRRAALRATLDVDNGSGGFTAQLYWAETLDGPWTQLGDGYTATGVTSIYSSSAPLEIAPNGITSTPGMRGRVHRAEVRNGIGGPIVADFDARTQPEGTAGWTDSVGRPWTVGPDATITDREFRFHGEISAWPSRWDVSGADVWVPIEAAGIRRRLGQGQKALASTLRRRVPAFAPLAYWPCEDEDGATQAYSPIEGVDPLTVTGGWRFGQDSSLAGSSALPSVEPSGFMVGPVPPSSASEWSVHMVYAVDSPPSASGSFLSWTSTGTIRRWNILQDSGVAHVRGYNAAGDLALDQAIGIGDDVFEGWQRIAFWAQESGGTVEWRIDWFNIGGPAGGFGDTFSGTVGRVTQMRTQFGAGISGLRVGHLAVFDVAITAAYTNADHGFSGESAIARMRRLANEESAQINLSWIDGDTTVDTERLGPQRPDTLLHLLRGAADTDGGILYEPADRLGLVYRDRASLYNQPVALALDYTAPGEVPPPLEPTEDDQRLRNDVTVTRSGGSSGRAVAETGPLSVEPPPDGVGIYDESVTLSLATDDQPARIAQWRLHLGTWDEARYPTITVWLHAAPHLVDDVLAMDIGDRVQISNPPPWLPPGVIDQHMHGYTERLGLYEWALTMNCAPAGPWQVGVVEDPVLGRADTDGSELSAGVTQSATSLSITTTAGPVWVTDPPQFPFDLTLGGEIVTAVAAGEVLTPNPLFLDGITGWVGVTGTLSHSTTVVHTERGATGSLVVTGIGVSSASGATSPNSPIGSITPGGSYTMSGWVYSPTGWSDMRVVTDWYTAADALISTGFGAVVPVAAGVWTFLTFTATAPATASRARVRVRVGDTPTVADVSYWWAVQLVADATVSASSPQTMTVVRSVNGIVKDHDAATPLSLTHPMRAAL